MPLTFLITHLAEWRPKIVCRRLMYKHPIQRVFDFFMKTPLNRTVFGPRKSGMGSGRGRGGGDGDGGAKIERVRVYFEQNPRKASVRKAADALGVRTDCHFPSFLSTGFMEAANIIRALFGDNFTMSTESELIATYRVRQQTVNEVLLHVRQAGGLILQLPYCPFSNRNILL